ncbi:tetratricopeptide repeat protein [Desulfovibrio inopinatus]|uniref:tetratricopeptide repeat protein n=1 Tax=Desulfovibrio inopinatus TaxID=102109 RepID=UPI000426E4C4|nr:tetratricopeptide repeat protein [Desulfovibrio inopinatus]
MPDKAVFQTATAGDNSPIYQVCGKNVSIGTQPRLKLVGPPPERPTPPKKTSDESIMLIPQMEFTTFLGRDDLLENFAAWATDHDPSQPVSVRVITGGAGIGKTRFARELCRTLSKTCEYEAGFVRDREARRFLSERNLSEWGWQKPTLAVFDYAMTLIDVLPGWMEELNDIYNSPYPLRILLLERQAEKDTGWLKQIFPDGFNTTDRLLDGEPWRLPDLDGPSFQLEIMQDMLNRLGSDFTLPKENTEFCNQLTQTDWAGTPLFLMMAAMVMHQQGGVGQTLSLRRTDLAKKIAGHEHSRLLKVCSDNRSLKIFLPHLAAFATLCGGLDHATLMDVIAPEQAAIGVTSLDSAVVAEILEDALPGQNGGVAPILPDIIGESFVLNYLGNRNTQASMDAVIRSFQQAPTSVPPMLVRCVEDFAPVALAETEVPDIKEQQLAIAWLQALGDQKTLPLVQLILLVGALPQDTLALRELAANWQQQIVDILSTGTSENHPLLAWRASSLNNLSFRLSALGRREEALEAAQEGASLYWMLVQQIPKAFENNFMITMLTWLSLRQNVSREEARELFEHDPESHLRALLEGVGGVTNK